MQDFRCGKGGKGRHDGFPVQVMDVKRLAGAIHDGVVAPRRQLVVARIAAPGEAATFGGDMKAESAVGNDIDPRMRRRAAARQPDHIFAATAAEPAVTVPEVEAIALRDSG